MSKRLLAFVALVACVAASGPAAAGEKVRLPEPLRNGGMPILDALAARRSDREFSDVRVSESDLSTLLWAAAGINRSDGKVTFPTVQGRNDMIVYAFTCDGVYKYLPETNELEAVARDDRRSISGTQPFVSQAAVNLVFVQDTSVWNDMPGASVSVFGMAHSSSIAQNVYLYAASRGWGAVTRASIDSDRIARVLGLPSDHAVCLAMSVGPLKSRETMHGLRLGGLTPEEALRYMTTTKRLLIVDVRPSRYRLDKNRRFFGAMPIAVGDIGQEAADELLMSLPADRPVIIHCGSGTPANRVYARLVKMRPEMSEVAYINGRPMFAEYEAWRQQQLKLGAVGK